MPTQIEGDGGKIIVWADDVTQFYGTLTSRGGSQSGNGGFREISGKGSLVFAGKVDLSAPKGAAGTVLFDPLNITISTNADANTGGFGDQVEAFGEDVGLTSNFDVTAGTGSFAGVASGTTIEGQAENDITLQTNFNLDTSTGNTGVHLTLRAGNKSTSAWIHNHFERRQRLAYCERRECYRAVRYRKHLG